jgi:hypothetical protein
MRVLHHGRAIVRQLSTRAERRSYRPGDFVLTRAEGGFARLLGAATGGPLDHAALIVDASGGLIEVNPQIAVGGSLLRRAHIGDYLDAGQPCWVGYVELQEGTRQAVVDFAERRYATQTPISAIGILTLVLQALLCVAPRARTERHAWLRLLHPLFDRHALILREEHTYLSGEFVARALERGGFLWDVDPAHITPAELFTRFHLRDESDAGVVVPLAHARRSRRAASAPPADRGPARVSPFVPRGQRSAPAARTLAGAAAYAAMPQAFEEATPDGVRTLMHVALFTAGGLTVVHCLELMARALRQES